MDSIILVQWVWMGKPESTVLHCAGSLCVGLWRRRGLAFIWMGPCFFLEGERRNRFCFLPHLCPLLALPGTGCGGNECVGMIARLAGAKGAVGRGRPSTVPEISMHGQALIRTMQAPCVLFSEALHSRNCNAPLWGGELKVWQLGFPGICCEKLCLHLFH